MLEGYTPEEVLAADPSELAELIFTGEPLVLRAGMAELLGEFRVAGHRLVLELAQIDGGGEGVLPTLGALAQRYAAREGLREIEWVVHAVSCAQPNLKLQRILDRRGFVVEEVPGSGMAYHMVQAVEAKPTDTA